jgi:hypothetical protein
MGIGRRDAGMAPVRALVRGYWHIGSGENPRAAAARTILRRVY